MIKDADNVELEKLKKRNVVLQEQLNAEGTLKEQLRDQLVEMKLENESMAGQLRSQTQANVELARLLVDQ